MDSEPSRVVNWAGGGSDRLKSMHLVLQLEAMEGELYGIEARLEVS